MFRGRPGRILRRDDGDTPRREFPNVREQRLRRRRVLEPEVIVHRGGVETGVDSGRQERRYLAPPDDAVVRFGVVQRFDADSIAGEHQRPGGPVPQREGEHAVEVVDQPLAHLLPEVDDDLDVTVRLEPVSRRSEPLAQGVVVVYLAVADGDDRPVLVSDGLAPTRYVDDREATGAHQYLGVFVDEPTLVVRPPVVEPLQHLRERFLVRSTEETGNPTHRYEGGRRSLAALTTFRTVCMGEDHGNMIR